MENDGALLPRGRIVAAVPAIITGLIDYPLAQEPDAARVATFHLILNLVALVIIGVSVWLRWGETAPNFSLVPVAVSTFAVVLVGLSGWLGGELVSRHHISVLEPEEK